MATDAVVLYNLALDLIGARAKISLPSEQSREAEACNLWFPQIRDAVLASAAWPEATKMERLAQLGAQSEETWLQGDPRPDLAYSYALPADCLRPQYLTSGGQFSIQHFAPESRALMTNSATPILVYTFRNTLVSVWSPELQMAIVYGLAANICPSLTGKTSRVKSLIEQANSRIISARETAANTNNEQFEVVPDWIAARGYSGSTPIEKYVYPFGALLTINNVG